MNRTRSLMAAQARAFAHMGFTCLILDLFGTGDSEGDLPDASWDTWCDDVALAADRLEHRADRPVMLWGIRLGSLLAAKAVDHQPGRFQRLLFWQPVASGETYLTQMLRLRVGALVDRGEKPETTADMRARLEAGDCVEVSGYLLPGRLAAALDKQKLTDCSGWAEKKIDWLECIADEGKPLPGGSQKAIAALEAAGATVDSHGVVAPPVWSLHKQADAAALVAVTSALFAT